MYIKFLNKDFRYYFDFLLFLTRLKQKDIHQLDMSMDFSIITIFNNNYKQ